MNEINAPVISILVPTRNRLSSLGAMLSSLGRLHDPPVAYEIIVVDNGSTDGTARLLQEWSAGDANRQVLQVTEPGRSRALNAGGKVSRGQWFAFLDDDVVVEPDYLVELWKYCEHSDCTAAQGSICLPPEAMSDPELRGLLQRYSSMFPLVNYSPDQRPTTLVGANMAVRREVLERVGPYDERLGAGAIGYGEDDDMADRILKAGGKIGYMAGAKVVHEVDRGRLTQEAYLERARKLGWSDCVRKSPGIWSWIIPRMAVTGLRLVLVTVCGMKEQRQRALARWHRYRGVLEVAWQGRAR